MMTQRGEVFNLPPHVVNGGNGLGRLCRITLDGMREIIGGDIQRSEIDVTVRIEGTKGHGRGIGDDLARTGRHRHNDSSRQDTTAAFRELG